MTGDLGQLTGSQESPAKETMLELDKYIENYYTDQQVNAQVKITIEEHNTQGSDGRYVLLMSQVF